MVLLKRLLQRKNAIDRFWQWFQEREELFYILPEEKKEKLFDELDRQLAKVNRQLILEVGAELIDGKRKIVVSADGVSKAFPDVIQMVEESPKLDRFCITAFRQPVSGDLTVEVNGLVLSHSALFFTGAINESTGRMDLVLYIKKHQKKEAFQGAALMLLDALVGEYKAGTCIGRIDCQPFDQNKQALPICELLAFLEQKMPE